MTTLLVFGFFGTMGALAIFILGYRKRVRALPVLLEVSRAKVRFAQFARVSAAFLLLAFMFAAFALSTSQLFATQKTGVIAYMCDESRSMGARNDEGVSRIERCKSIIRRLDSFSYSVVSVYGFTERAFSHSSFSMNHDHFQKTVASLVAVEAVPGTGSEIGFSTQSVILDTAKKRDALGKKSAIVVLLSDGESTSQNEREDSIRAIQEAKKSNVTVLAIGIGEHTAVKIPIYEDGVLVGYEKGGRDKDGNDLELVTKLDETTLRTLGEGSGGLYVHERELEKARAYLTETLLEEKIMTQGGASNLARALLIAALAPLAVLIKYSFA